MTDITITGMTCANCAKKVESLLKPLASDVRVTHEPPRASAAVLSATAVNATLQAAGVKYRAVEHVSARPSWIKTYQPLLIVIGLIAIASFAAQNWMLAFMGGFFTVFGAFKLLDVPAFADAYARYDVIAKMWKGWGLVYPFVETALGLAFLFHFHVPLLLWAALVVSVVGAVGVIQANLNKQTIQCACLGTVFQLPMSVVTIVENVGMAAMAAAMIIFSA